MQVNKKPRILQPQINNVLEIVDRTQAKISLTLDQPAYQSEGELRKDEIKLE